MGEGDGGVRVWIANYLGGGKGGGGRWREPDAHDDTTHLLLQGGQVGDGLGRAGNLLVMLREAVLQLIDGLECGPDLCFMVPCT